MWRVGHGSTVPVQESGGVEGVKALETTGNDAPIDLNTDAPASIPKRQKTTSAGSAIGFLKPMVFAAMLGAGLATTTAASAQQVQGAPLTEGTVISMPAQSFDYAPNLQQAINIQHTIA